MRRRRKHEYTFKKNSTLSSEKVSCCSDTAVVSRPAGWILCYKGKETLPLYHSVIWPGETTACRVEGKHQQRLYS